VRASEDVAHVVDFLIADLFTDDEALFSGFVTWTADISHRPGCFSGHIVFRSRPFGLTNRSEFPRCRRRLLAAESALADKKSSATDPQLNP
jgi:hypothetical protein